MKHFYSFSGLLGPFDGCPKGSLALHRRREEDGKSYQFILF